MLIRAIHKAARAGDSRKVRRLLTTTTPKPEHSATPASHTGAKPKPKPKPSNTSVPAAPSAPNTAPRLIFGLGNPGDAYKMTRHNIGFLCVDKLAESVGAQFSKSKFDSEFAEFNHEGIPVYIIKPQTFMNLSGSAVRRWVDSLKVPLINCMVVVDAAELPIGEIRIKPKGSSAGQNGLKSIISTLKTEAFPRLRVGIGRPPHKDMDLRDYVLGRWNAKEQAQIKETTDHVSMCIQTWLSEGPDKAATRWNKSLDAIRQLLEKEAEEKKQKPSK